MIQKETFEQETVILVHSVVQREQGVNLPHQGGGFLGGSQGDRHESLIPLESVEGVELSEAFLEGLVGQLVQRELDEVHYLRSVCTHQSSDAVVKLREASSKSSDSKLSFCLSKLLSTSCSLC